MKIIKIYILLQLMLSLNGCSLFGWYDQGDPHPYTKLDIDEWTKSNTDEVKRKEDWISCGGYSGGSVHLTPLKHNGLPTTEEYIQMDKEYDAVQACMMKKGYKFIGSCRGPLGRRLSCKGRSIFNL